MTDQTRPDQTRPDQTRPDQTRPDSKETRIVLEPPSCSLPPSLCGTDPGGILPPSAPAPTFEVLIQKFGNDNNQLQLTVGKPADWNVVVRVRDLKYPTSPRNSALRIEDLAGNFNIETASTDAANSLVWVRLAAKASARLGDQQIKAIVTVGTEIRSATLTVKVISNVITGWIAVNALSQVSITGIEYAVDQTKVYINSISGLNDSQIETKFREFLTNATSVYPASASVKPREVEYDDLLPRAAGQLNSLEANICNESGYTCALMLIAAKNGTAASGEIFSWQQRGVDNEKDSMRHSSWNAYMTIYIGSYKAKRFADAHEYGSSTQAQGGIGQQMDFYNNEVGRNIGNTLLSTGAASNAAVVNQTKSDIKVGRMRIVSRAYPTEVTPSGTSLVFSDTYRQTWPLGF